jgi:rare lipoprotein A
MRRLGWTLVAALVAGSGCSLVRGPTTPPVVGGVQVGVASWYGPGFHGRRTANGEVFDQNELTAAHQTLPHGTHVMVTNLDNDRSVEVRINDRGPFVGGRVIDLSYAAARAIRMVGPGTARVRLEVLGDAPPPVVRRVAAPAPIRAAAAPPPAAPPPVAPAAVVPAAAVSEPPRRPPALRDPESIFAVEVAALSDPARAEHLRSRLAIRFADTFVAPLAAGESRYYRVRLGPYPMRAVALANAELVSRMGYAAIIVEDPR